ncbi:urease accessory protein UreD [Natrarchaeobaculum aegyptiacum]|uniref:Urease accessory protein UreD n=1 Tax=Natrarchaeobaculum aegyptiacum TaxID=745377 RepID=A0A2Z2HRT8_9EURY|nr:urease accessory protein UreD [Natrarchaeobaculum aegyptiacum]ARS88795.1 urease accessory protein ureD [Natrarchaeobaculum aegyptiacum]
MSTAEAVDPDANRLPPAFEAYAEEPLEQAPAMGPGKNGLLEATLARSGDAPTRLVRDHVKVPYHLTGTLETDPAPGLTTLVTQEPTGGVAQGDCHRMVIDATAGSRAHVTTQSATKVHSMQANYAHLDASLTVESGAYLEYMPGSTIVNEDARCLQTVGLDLEPGSVAVVSDVLVPDGLSDHEPFGFDHYHARVEATCDGTLVCADAVDLRPAERDPRDPASVGEYGVVGSLYVFAPTGDEGSLVEDAPTPPLESLTEAIADRLDDLAAVHAGVSTLPADSGTIVRVLGHQERAVTAAIRTAWDETRQQTLGVGTPADRRY